MKLPSKVFKKIGRIPRIIKIQRICGAVLLIWMAGASPLYGEHFIAGEDWIQLERVNPSGQLYYVAGLIESVIQSDYEYYYNEMHLPVSYERIVILLNEFYKDYRNIKIPVFHSIRAIRMQISGEEDEATNNFILELRRLSMTLE